MLVAPPLALLPEPPVTGAPPLALEVPPVPDNTVPPVPSDTLPPVEVEAFPPVVVDAVPPVSATLLLPPCAGPVDSLPEQAAMKTTRPIPALHLFPLSFMVRNSFWRLHGPNGR